MGEHSVIMKTPRVKPLEGSCRNWLSVLDGTDTYKGFVDLRAGFFIFFHFNLHCRFSALDGASTDQEKCIFDQVSQPG